MSAPSAQMVAAGLDVPDPMPDIELQDEAPAKEKRQITSGTELTSLFVRESGQQGPAVRGPIELHELVDEDSDVSPVVHYRRLSRDDRREIQKRVNEIYDEENKRAREEEEEPVSVQEEITLAIFLLRALRPDGKRMFSPNQFGEALDGNWNHECIARVVGEMATGSKTRLSDADLGNS